MRNVVETGDTRPSSPPECLILLAVGQSARRRRVANTRKIQTCNLQERPGKGPAGEEQRADIASNFNEPYSLLRK